MIANRNTQKTCFFFFNLATNGKWINSVCLITVFNNYSRLCSLRRRDVSQGHAIKNLYCKTSFNFTKIIINPKIKNNSNPNLQLAQ